MSSFTSKTEKIKGETVCDVCSSIECFPHSLGTNKYKQGVVEYWTHLQIVIKNEIVALKDWWSPANIILLPEFFMSEDFMAT